MLFAEIHAHSSFLLLDVKIIKPKIKGNSTLIKSDLSGLTRIKQEAEPFVYQRKSVPSAFYCSSKLRPQRAAAKERQFTHHRFHADPFVADRERRADCCLLW
jgi:hypothetical protein